ncbi:MAG: energy transducer TonB [Ignavibacteriales bacterium]|nr:energy transducer TonB [Ignavibacteriales bacterium]
MAILKTKKADLNIHYKKYLKISIIIVLTLLIAAFKFSPNQSKQPSIKEDPGCIINIFDIPPTELITKPLLPPRPQLPEISTGDNIIDIEFDATDFDLTENISPPAELEKPSNRIVEEEDHIPFFRVEVKPEIIGGLESILKNVYYTEIARRAMIEGRVTIEFIVNKNGNVEDATVLKGISEELDLIALNAVKQARFTPGLQRGKPVMVKMVIPIVYKLK